MFDDVVNPSRRVRQAIGSLTSIAWTCTTLGVIAAAPLLLALLVGRTRFAYGHVLYFAVVAIATFLPATWYWILARHLRGRRPWAAIAAIATASLHCAMALGGLTWLSILIVKHVIPSAGFVLGAVGLGVAALCVHVVVSSARALRVLHLIDDTMPAGFIPMLTEPHGIESDRPK